MKSPQHLAPGYELERTIDPRRPAYALARLIRAANVAERQLEDLHRGQGWSLAGFRIMFSLLNTGHADPSGLSRSLGITPPSVTSALRTLERGGFVNLSRLDDNRRQVRVELTPAGRSAIEGVLVPHSRQCAAFLDALNERDRQDLARVVEKLLAAHWPK